jgi:hypothetical protein
MISFEDTNKLLLNIQRLVNNKSSITKRKEKIKKIFNGY